MMREKFDKILEKKGKKIDPSAQKAKEDVLSDLHGQASDAAGSKLGNLKKVAVESPSKEGLQAGLDKAKELLSNVPDDSDDNDYHAVEGHNPEGSPEEEASESPEEESQESEHDDMSPEEIDQKIQLLMALKHQKMQGK